MGVKGLWSLVENTSTPVHLEMLANKRLAIDASIWLHQFIRAMRDKQGNMLHNAHIVGFLRRICKLLYYNIRPVFVFDGGVPALKRNTIAERRRQQEQTAQKVTKTAEKILQAHAKLQALQQERRGDAPPLNQGKTPLAATVASLLHDRANGQQRDEYVLPDLHRVHYVDRGEVITSRPLGQRSSPHRSSPKRSQSMPTSIQKTSRPPLFPSKRTVASPTAAKAAPPLQEVDDEEEEEEERADFAAFMAKTLDKLDDIDTEADAFKSLPRDVQIEILTELKLRQKHTSFQHIQRTLRKKSIPKAMRPSTAEQIFPEGEASEEEEDKNDAMRFSKAQILGVIKRNKVTSHLMHAVSNDWSNDNGRSIETGRVAAEKRKEYVLVRDSDDAGWTMASKQEMEEKAQSERDKVKERITQSVAPYQRPTPQKRATIAVTDPTHHPLSSESDEFEEADHPTGDVFDDAALFVSDATTDEEMDHRGSETEDKTPQKPIFHRIVDDNTAIEVDSEEDVFTPVKSTMATPAQPPVSIPSSPVVTPSKPAKSPSIVVPPSVSSSIDVDDVLSLLESMPSPTTTPFQVGQEGTPHHIASQLNAFIPPLVHAKIPQLRSMALDVLSSPRFAVPKNLREQNVMLFRDAIHACSVSFQEEKDRSLLRLQLQTHEDEQVDADLAASLRIWLAILSRLVRYCEVWQTLALPPSTPAAGPPPPPTEGEDEEMDSFLFGISSMLEPVEKPSDHLDDQAKEHREKEAVPRQEPMREEEMAKKDQEEAPSFSGDERMSPKATEAPKEAAVPKEGMIDLDGPLPHLHREDVFLIEDDDQGNDAEAIQENFQKEQFEFARLVSEMNAKDMVSAERDLEKELDALHDEHRQAKRHQATVESEMTKDTQDLLSLFGIPYIIAPMEAEAQCAALQELKLVDGIVTDDSDIFLFGGKTVYKNLFNQNKYVEMLQLDKIKSTMQLDREAMIQIAYLCGSDYTEGLDGVGPVTAIEIIGEFTKGDEAEGALSTLQSFKAWFLANRLATSDTENNAFRKKLVPFLL